MDPLGPLSDVIRAQQLRLSRIVHVVNGNTSEVIPEPVTFAVVAEADCDNSNVPFK